MKEFKGEMSMQDKIEIIGTNTIIQHGELNKRVYLIKLDERDVNNITSLLNVLARERSYSKIFCKVPAWAAPVFNADGFIMEAFIPGFYGGRQGVCFMSKFLNSDRLLGIENEALKAFSKMLGDFRSPGTYAPAETTTEKEAPGAPAESTNRTSIAAMVAKAAKAARTATATRTATVADATASGSGKNAVAASHEAAGNGVNEGHDIHPGTQNATAGMPLKDAPEVRSLSEEEADEISDLYKRVFKSYPFPIHDPNYIRKTMREQIRYFGIREQGNLIALSSAEMDPDAENAEMTDFATLPEARGKRTAYHLLCAMEKEMQMLGIKTVYTIARLNSLPMNKTFLKHGYTYSGTLINNTNIAGSIESMNVLYKHIN